MIKKALTLMLLSCTLLSCVHTPSYYASLEIVTYERGDTRFSDNALNNRTNYGLLSLREDGACSITEIRDGLNYRGSGAWSQTEHEDIIRIGLSSNSTMTMYHFYVRLYEDTNSYIVSDVLDMLLAV